jgi:uncharacterized protein (DUF1684 family)
VSITLLDWRRRVAALYADVRRVAVEDPAAAHALWRRTRDDLFATHPDSPLPPQDRSSFTGLPYAPYDPALRFDDVEVEETERARLDIDSGADGVVPLERIGRAVLPEIGGLDVWWLAVYGGGVFLPIRDATGGRTTYGGGRYVLDTVKGADLGAGRAGAGTLVVDLNFAYNPSCAYDPRWVCPLAPPGNVVGVEVPVGELALT